MGEPAFPARQRLASRIASAARLHSLRRLREPRLLQRRQNTFGTKLENGSTRFNNQLFTQIRMYIASLLFLLGDELRHLSNYIFKRMLFFILLAYENIRKPLLYDE